ncbi:MAG TPA: hypothetical protein VF622_13260, partial [Segetibacter sp.]
MKPRNLLEEWYKEAFERSSRFRIQLPVLEREAIDFIYHTLLSFFGTKFFTVSPHQDKAIEKTSWLLSLLSNNKQA